MNGLIVINKPPGVTSHTVVKRVKNILKVRKAGHTGTLDPFATGVLTVCLNEGTKLAPFLVEDDKEYQALLLLGIETDTQDITGHIIAEKVLPQITRSDIERTLQTFQGKIMQMPPMYSALKYNGIPLYRLARKGKEIERAQREIEIKEFSVLKIDLPRILFRVACSKGTYIRTLANDVGKHLGCGACLEMLTRTRSGDFRIENSISLETLEKTSLEEIQANWIISPVQALGSFPEIVLDQETSRKVYQGKTITGAELKEKTQNFQKVIGKIKILTPQRDLIAVAEANNSSSLDLEKPVWKLLRVFNREQ